MGLWGFASLYPLLTVGMKLLQSILLCLHPDGAKTIRLRMSSFILCKCSTEHWIRSLQLQGSAMKLAMGH